jgi:hypothetical protein
MDTIRNFEWDGILRVFRREKELDPQGIASHGGRSKRFSAGDEHTTRDYVVRGAQLFFLLIALFINVAIAGVLRWTRSHMESSGGDAVFQKNEKVGPSALTALNFIIVIQALILSAALLAIPLLHDRVGYFKGTC